MGAVLSLPFFRRKRRQRRPTVSTPISHPRPLLRRDAEEIELVDSSLYSRKAQVGRSGSGASRSSRMSVSSRSRGQRVRREVGEFGVIVSRPLAEVVEVAERETEDSPSMPSMSSGSNSSCSSNPKLTTPDEPLLPSTAATSPALQTELRQHGRSPSISGIGSKRRSLALEPERRTRPRPRSGSDSRRSSIVGTKTASPAIRRASTIRKHRRRLESGWDLIRHDEADGWAPAAGRSVSLRAGLGWSLQRSVSMRRVQWTGGRMPRWPQAVGV